ncbi:MAG: hypothetical protein ABI689_00310 [Thermoanaerobaculia bacterium]
MAGEGESQREESRFPAALPVTFYVAEPADLTRVSRLDPDRDQALLRSGELAWVVQTYLRLRAAGYPVELAASPPRSGLVVFHAKHGPALTRALTRAQSGRRDLRFVGIRADNSPPLLADFEILQNGRFADDRRRFWIPHWPQPGLIARDAERGNRVERVTYMGWIENLHAGFRSSAWRAALAGLGIEWVLQEVPFPRGGGVERSAQAPVDFEDYSRFDALLAVRPGGFRRSLSKPVSKLVNAWRAGLPALLGPEYACREVRRSDDDYFEIAGPEEALAALRRLRAEPLLYARMVENGRNRAAEFSFAALTERWADLLLRSIPSQVASGGLPWSHRLPLPLRLSIRRFLRALRREGVR